MPLYEYECLKCGERFEVIQKFSDELFRVHSDSNGTGCDGKVRKLLAAPAIQFKGSGWYVTDYGRGGKKPAAEAAESDSKKEAKSAEPGKKAKAAPKKPGKASAKTAAAG